MFSGSVIVSGVKVAKSQREERVGGPAPVTPSERSAVKVADQSEGALRISTAQRPRVGDLGGGRNRLGHNSWQTVGWRAAK